MWYDLIIAALLVFSTLRGASRGFAWQVATIGSLILCFAFAETASLALAPMIGVEPPLNRWIAMFILYLGASFVSFAAARTVRKTLQSWQFEEYDRHLGAVFGLLKGVAFGLVITFFAVTLSESGRETVLRSYSGFYAGRILVGLHPVMPDGFHGIVDPYLEKLGQTVVHDDDFGQSPGTVLDDAGLPNQPFPGGSPDFGAPPQFGTSPPRGDDFRGPSDFGPQPLVGTVTPASGQGSPRATADSDLRRYIDQLPGVSQEVRQLAWTAVQNTSAADRDELLRKFQTAIPGLIKATATEWQRGKPRAADQRSRRDETLREIAAVYTENLDGQKWIIQEAEQRLRGVPDDIALVVVQDWYADLLSLTPDPDTATNLATRIEVRITRQLQSFGVSLDSLGSDVRSRLGTTTR